VSYLNFCLIKPVGIFQQILNFPIHLSTIFLVMLLGFLICFTGYRIVYWIIGLCGFCILSSSSFLLLEGYATHLFPLTIALSFFLGILGSLFAIFFYKSGIFLLGVIGGFSFGIVLLPVMNIPIILLISGILGGILSFVIEKIIIVVATSSIGSLIVVWAIVRLLELIGILSITPDFEPSYFRMISMLTWLGLGLLGCAIQYKYSKSTPKKRNETL